MSKDIIVSNMEVDEKGKAEVKNSKKMPCKVENKEMIVVSPDKAEIVPPGIEIDASGMREKKKDEKEVGQDR